MITKTQQNLSVDYTNHITEKEVSRYSSSGINTVKPLTEYVVGPDTRAAVRLPVKFNKKKKKDVLCPLTPPITIWVATGNVFYHRSGTVAKHAIPPVMSSGILS